MKVSEKFTENDRTYAIISEIYPDDNREFRVRVIDADETVDGEDLLIAGDELMNYIHPGEWEDAYEGFKTDAPKLSPEESAHISEDVYNEIFFFTDDTTLGYTDKELLFDIREDNPDYFVW